MFHLAKHIAAMHLFILLVHLTLVQCINKKRQGTHSHSVYYTIQITTIPELLPLNKLFLNSHFCFIFIFLICFQMKLVSSGQGGKFTVFVTSQNQMCPWFIHSSQWSQKTTFSSLRNLGCFAIYKLTTCL